jgi:hypothetical protein
MAYTGPFPIPVKDGGTGTATLTSDCVLIGNGTGAISAFAPATNGQLIIGNTGTVPSLGNLTSTGATITITNGAGTINLEAAGGGGAGASFSAYLSTDTGAVTGDGTTYNLVCDTVVSDTATKYNNTTGIYTIPTTGTYLFTTTVVIQGASGGQNVASVAFVTQETTYNAVIGNPVPVTSGGSQWGVTASQLLVLAANDTVVVQIVVGNGTLDVTIGGGVGSPAFIVQTSFSGFMVG